MRGGPHGQQRPHSRHLPGAAWRKENFTHNGNRHWALSSQVGVGGGLGRHKEWGERGGWESDWEGRRGWKPKKVEGSGSFCFPDLPCVADDEMSMMSMRGEESATRLLPSLVITKAKMLQMLVHGGCSEVAQLPNCTTSGSLSWTPLGKALAPDELPPPNSAILSYYQATTLACLLYMKSYHNQLYTLYEALSAIIQPAHFPLHARCTTALLWKSTTAL